MSHEIPREEEFGVDFIDILPSGRRSNLHRNSWQPYFPGVPVVSQVREPLKSVLLFIFYLFIFAESQIQFKINVFSLK